MHALDCFHHMIALRIKWLTILRTGRRRPQEDRRAEVPRVLGQDERRRARGLRACDSRCPAREAKEERREEEVHDLVNYLPYHHHHRIERTSPWPQSSGIPTPPSSTGARSSSRHGAERLSMARMETAQRADGRTGVDTASCGFVSCGSC